LWSTEGEVSVEGEEGEERGEGCLGDYGGGFRVCVGEGPWKGELVDGFIFL